MFNSLKIVVWSKKEFFYGILDSCICEKMISLFKSYNYYYFYFREHSSINLNA